MLTLRLDYHAQRLRWCRAALRDFLRRWAAYVCVALLVFGVAAPGSLFLPLVRASDQGWWLLPMTALYGVLGMLPVVLTRPLWWPPQWADAERALPLAAHTLVASDRRVALWVMLPWQGMLVVGILLWLQQGGAAAPGMRGSCAAWAVSALVAWAGSVLWMQAVRARAGQRRGPAIDEAKRVGGVFSGPSIRPLTWTSALIVLPLLREPAQRTARALAVGVLSNIAGSIGVAVAGTAMGWALGALAAAALIATSLLRVRFDQELTPLYFASANLPIPPRRWYAARLLLLTLPVLVGLVCLAVVLLTHAAPSLRWPVLAAYAVVLALSCAWEATPTVPGQPFNHAPRWLLTLVLTVCIGSEVLA